MNRKSFQRFTLSLIGVFVILVTWSFAVGHLYHLPAAALSAFTTITVNAQYTIAAIIIFMVTGRLIYEWRMNTASTVIEKGEQLFEEKIDRTPAPKHFDDEEIP
jgi:hypothetical protein